jgi:hypothetical protein
MCGNFRLASAGQHTFRLEYKQSVNGTITDSFIYSSAHPSGISFKVRPIDQAVPAPLLVNSVVSSYSGIARIESGEVYYDGGVPYKYNIGDWISSLVDNGTGDVTVNIKSGSFSTLPICTCFVAQSANGICTASTPWSSSQITFQMKNLSGTLTDYNIMFICMGPR